MKGKISPVPQKRFNKYYMTIERARNLSIKNWRGTADAYVSVKGTNERKERGGKKEGGG
jgi:hypothetical protein